ncbi:MAG: hypothetical protein IJD81_02210 [Oscillospiraceae bacterium]|nr:hypothetical protein [Oscillospiraceae bacterium]
MRIRDGLYLIHRPDYHVTVEDAMNLIRFLSTDIASVKPKVYWCYHPERNNSNLFLGTGLNDGKERVIIQKYFYKDGMDVILEFYEGPLLRYSVVNLCFEPETSALLKLYAQVAPRVFEHALRHRTSGRMLREINPK